MLLVITPTAAKSFSSESDPFLFLIKSLTLVGVTPLLVLSPTSNGTMIFLLLVLSPTAVNSFIFDKIQSVDHQDLL
jgi:hypothetical protein